MDAQATPDGFADFVRDRSRELLRAAWLLTANWASAEDLVQIALSEAWPRWDSLETPAAYVHKILLTSYLRSQRRRWSDEISYADLPDRVGNGDAYAAVDAHSQAATALAILPPKQRAVVVLRYFVDLSEAETARVLGCSVGAVKTHSSRAMATLRTAPGLAEVLRGGVTS